MNIKKVIETAEQIIFEKDSKNALKIFNKLDLSDSVKKSYLTQIKKYVMKNTEGVQIDSDLYGTNTSFGSAREPSTGRTSIERFNSMSLFHQSEMLKKNYGDSSSDYMTALKSEFHAKFPSYVKNIKAEEELLRKIRAKTAENVSRRSQNVILLEADSLRGLLADLRGSLSSLRNMSEKEVAKMSRRESTKVLAAVALLTGRRMSELLSFESSSTFTSLDNTPADRACYFSGQLKTNTPNKYSIPLLGNFADIQNGLKFLRVKMKLKPGATPQEINRRFTRFSHEAAQGVKQILAGFGATPSETSKIHFHTLREMYACITYMTFTNTYSTHGWIRRVLGHNDIDSSRSYSNFKWIGELGENHPPFENLYDSRTDTCKN